MWAGFAELARSRVDVVAAYEQALSSGLDDPALRREAASASHKLAGALGSYGREGSDDAGALEVLLRSSDRPDPRLVADHLAALRSATGA